MRRVSNTWCRYPMVVAACVLGVAWSVVGFNSGSAVAWGEPPAAPRGALWWCTEIATKDGGSFESQCFASYGECVNYRGHVVPHEQLIIGACASRPRAWVLEIAGRSGVDETPVYEARQSKEECQRYKRALIRAPGGKHLRVSACRNQRPARVTGRNAPLLRIERFDGVP